jgi:hypothetical protein
MQPSGWSTARRFSSVSGRSFELRTNTTLSDRGSAAANQRPRVPGSPSAKRGCGIVFNEHGGPQPHARSGLAAFSPFAGIRASTGSRARRFPAPLPDPSRTWAERNTVRPYGTPEARRALPVKGTHRRQREAVRRPPRRTGQTAREAPGHRARTKCEASVLASRGPSRHRSACPAP